jgi:hypothetical protein
MKKGHNKVTFKPYTMAQPALLPQNLEELIPEDHLVRVVNRVIDSLDLEPILSEYKGGGTIDVYTLAKSLTLGNFASMLDDFLNLGGKGYREGKEVYSFASLTEPFNDSLSALLLG